MNYASGGTWTLTTIAGLRILSPVCLPIPPHSQLSILDILGIFIYNRSTQNKILQINNFF